MSARRSWIQAVVIAVVAVAAGCEDYKQRPQLFVDITPDNPFDFGRWYIGASPQASLAITNKGLEDLVITSVELTGGAPFCRPCPDRCGNTTVGYDPCPNPTLLTVPGNKSSFFTVVFRPTTAGDYTGKVTIVSNAENAPSQEIQVLGTGVP